jgi:signal transduction histidine kinase
MVVQAIHQDRSGGLWLGTLTGLVRWNEQEWTPFTTRDGLSANDVWAIVDDAEGNLWIGTRGGGLNRFRDGKFTAFRKEDGLPSDNISSLYVDSDGVLWIATRSGLARLHAGKWSVYTTRDGLISNSLRYLIEDAQGYLWIGSNAGLMRVPKKALNDFARGAAAFIPCRTYGTQDGLPTSECTLGSQPGACRARDGKLWFPTIKGLVSVDPAKLNPNTNPPPVMIESVLIEGESQNTNRLRTTWPEAIVIPAGKERLEIHYTSLNLAAPEQARFKYRMEGHETDWTDAGNIRVVRYSKLPAGNFRFQVLASNEDGIWSETGSSLAFIVQPPFWQTWWFLSGAAVALLGTVVSVVHYLSTQKLQRQLASLKQQEALEKERARIARDIHDQLGANLTQVALLGELVESDKDTPEEVEVHARQICHTARETTRTLDEIVWTVNPSNDTLEGLITYICKHAQDYLAVAGVRYRLDVPAQLPEIAVLPEVRHNVFLASKEAVTNVVRHATASSVCVRLRLVSSSFTLEVEDNGRGVAGMDEKAVQSRNGLRNMRKRMADIGGDFSIGPGTDGGTLVRLTAPLGNHSARHGN